MIWFDAVAKDGLVPLDRLPDGTHWLVAASDFEERTAFQVTLPTPEHTIERRLRLSSGWVTKSIEINPSVDRTDPTDEIIVVEVHNSSGARITLTEDDFSLTMFPGQHRVLAPRPSETVLRDSTRLTIADGKSGTFRLSWRRWVRQGLWAAPTAENIDEPWSVEAQAGRIQLRVYLGNLGAVPVFVTEPGAITEPPAAGGSGSTIPQARSQAETGNEESQSVARETVRRELETQLAIDQESLASKIAELDKRLVERESLVKRGGNTAQLDWQIAMGLARPQLFPQRVSFLRDSRQFRGQLGRGGRPTGCGSNSSTARRSQSPWSSGK